MTLIASTESRPDAKRVRSTALRGEKASPIDQRIDGLHVTSAVRRWAEAYDRRGASLKRG